MRPAEAEANPRALSKAESVGEIPGRPIENRPQAESLPYISLTIQEQLLHRPAVALPLVSFEQ